uniref:Jacalin-type lectin domain-containing protein n=1 Tax=Salarias fasciatus TaxID=181472 RepID=A0A672F6E9_SALFA
MFSLVVIAVLCTSCLAARKDSSSLHQLLEFGSGKIQILTLQGQSPFSLTYTYLFSSPNISRSLQYTYLLSFCSLQVRYGTTWSPTIGREVGTAQELLLQGHEAITQVSGKHSASYILQLYFVTSHGRILVAGQPTWYSFNMFPQYRGAVLKTLHGRVNSAGITSLGAQWGMFYFSNSRKRWNSCSSSWVFQTR